MSIKTQIKKLEQYEVTHRSGFDRLGALVLTAATVFGMTSLGQKSNDWKREIIARPAYAFNSAAENEMERLPIKFDDGLTSQGNSGL